MLVVETRLVPFAGHHQDRSSWCFLRGITNALLAITVRNRFAQMLPCNSGTHVRDAILLYSFICLFALCLDKKRSPPSDPEF